MSRSLRRFHRIIQHRSEVKLDAWIADAKAGLMASFVTGIVQDLAAVKAALTEPWSNGPSRRSGRWGCYGTARSL
jgi:transposase